jgi:hypothetical protein
MAFPADMAVQASEQRFGVALGIRTRNPDWPVVILRTSDDGTVAPATASAIILRVLPPGQLYTEDVLENDGATRWYFGYHYRPTYDTTLPTTDKWVGAAPQDLDDVVDPYQDYQTEGKRRVDTIYDQDSIIKEEVSQVTADVSRQLLRGYLAGLTSDGGSVAFAPVDGHLLQHQSAIPGKRGAGALCGRVHGLRQTGPVGHTRFNGQRLPQQYAI